MSEVEESKNVQKTVNLSLGLSDVVDEEAMAEILNANKKKSTVNLSLGLGRMNSYEEGSLQMPGNPMLKIGLEVATDLDVDTNETKGSEDLLSMTEMMSALCNDSLEGEAWEIKADTREERANTECNVILEQLGLTGADVMTEETECWEKKASNTASQSKDKESIPTESVFNMLGLSETDIQTTGEAWESKTGL
mmetsp:Transcript_24838/g.42047  ORF Transcript_24838/g.42047 Transcript_24838/m.42047 type:complete len:194 (+) Transcript_24838:61-642(+)